MERKREREREREEDLQEKTHTRYMIISQSIFRGHVLARELIRSAARTIKRLSEKLSRAARVSRATSGTPFYLTHYEDVNESGSVYSSPTCNGYAHADAILRESARTDAALRGASLAGKLKFIGGLRRSGTAVAANRKKSRKSHCSSTYRVSPRNMILAWPSARAPEQCAATARSA